MPIGREREFEILVDAARDAAGGRGSIVFVDGPVGSGKSFLLNALAEDCRSSERKQRLETVSVRCYETSAGNPLGPFGEVLRALTSRERRGDRAKRILELVGNVAPSLLELIPVVGKLAAVGLKAASDVGVYALGGDHEGQQAQLASDVALTLDAIAAEIPLLIVIDDAQWIDAPSTEVIVRLAEGVANRGLLLLIAYDRALVDDRHPLVRVRSALLRRAGVSKIVLANFGVEEVETVLRDRYGDVPGKGLAEWLLDLTDGSPLFVQQNLATLEEQGVLRLCDGAWVLDGTIEGGPGDWRLHGGLVKAQTPDTLLELLRPRVADLDDEERALLQTGAVQGRRFLSAVIAKQLDREEDEILDRLDQLQQRRQMITIDQTEDWWSDRSNLYAFDPGTVQELLYGRYARSAYERRRRHRAVAQVLETLIAEDHPPPRQALLEIARHYEAAGDPLASARRLVDVADSTFAEGADRETAANAERAVTLLRTALLGAPDHDRLEVYRPLARAIILLLLAGESSWHPEATDTRGARLLGLAKEATRVADAVGDPALRASARYAAALVLISHRGLQEGIASFREALELARLAGDQVAEFAILINLGHHLDSVRLEEGWNVLQDAQALLMEPALAAGTTFG